MGLNEHYHTFMLLLPTRRPYRDFESVPINCPVALAPGPEGLILMIGL
jgi:hypothetical protein